MKTREQIKKELKDGDYITIAKMVGCTSDYVNKVFNGTRNSVRIVEAANWLVESRDELIESFPKKH